MPSRCCLPNATTALLLLISLSAPIHARPHPQETEPSLDDTNLPLNATGNADLTDPSFNYSAINTTASNVTSTDPTTGNTAGSLPPSLLSSSSKPLDTHNNIPSCMHPPTMPLLQDCMLALTTLPNDALPDGRTLPLIHTFIKSATITSNPYELPKLFEVGTCIITIKFVPGRDRDTGSWSEIANLGQRAGMGCLRGEMVNAGWGKTGELRLTTAGAARAGRAGGMELRIWRAEGVGVGANSTTVDGDPGVARGAAGGGLAGMSIEGGGTVGDVARM